MADSKPTARPETVKAAKPAYVAPVVTTYTSSEIVEQVGPALTCSGTPCIPN